MKVNAFDLKLFIIKIFSIVMHEFQKIFGFLSLSQRTYGDASLLMNALDYEETNKGWGEWEVAIQGNYFVIMPNYSYNGLIY